jgi:hypothetical protein
VFACNIDADNFTKNLKIKNKHNSGLTEGYLE